MTVRGGIINEEKKNVNMKITCFDGHICTCTLHLSLCVLVGENDYMSEAFFLLR